MFLILFVLSESAGKSPDLFPPFHPSEDGKIGLWELGGSAIHTDDAIMVVPPLQYRRGSLWTNLEFPQGDFSIDYKFRIYEGTNGGNLAFWFIDRYGADGDLGGGPRNFKGVAVIMTVRRSTRGSQQSLGWHVIQHSEHSTLIPDTEMVQPGLVIPFTRTSAVTLTIAFKGGDLKIVLTAGTEKTPIFEGKVTVDLSTAFIGVTAQSDMFTSRFDLEHIKFTLPKSSREREGVSFGEDRPKSNYLPETDAALRNPVFVKTIQALLTQLNGTGSFTNAVIATEDILDVINELTYASNSVGSYKELNDWVRKTLIPYTQKWHRRTAKIVDNNRDARNVMGAAWNYTHELVLGLNNTVSLNSRKAQFKLQDLGDLFEKEAEQLVGQADRVTEKKGKLTLFEQFTAVTITLEGIFLLVFFFVMQKAKFRVALFGR
jgi:hypothetical protein